MDLSSKLTWSDLSYFMAVKHGAYDAIFIPASVAKIIMTPISEGQFGYNCHFHTFLSIVMVA